MADRDDPRSKTYTSNERKAVQTPSEPEARARRSASAEGLSAIEDALLPTRAREPARTRENVTPLPRPVQKPQPRPKQEPLPRPAQKPRTIQAPESVEEYVASRPARPPESPIQRSDYRAPQAHEPGFLGAVVAIVSMVAVLVGLALAYWLLRR
jgi:hypothetical protein